jgi:acyl-CoA dehydrogenase
MEEFAWGDPGFSTASYTNGLTSAPIITGATEDQKTEYLGRLTAAPKIASYCVTEPAAGSDVQAIETTAVREGDHYVLNGEKNVHFRSRSC